MDAFFVYFIFDYLFSFLLIITISMDRICIIAQKTVSIVSCALDFKPLVSESSNNFAREDNYSPVP